MFNKAVSDATDFWESINPTASSTAYGDQWWHENSKVVRRMLLKATSLVFFGAPVSYAVLTCQAVDLPF